MKDQYLVTSLLQESLTKNGTSKVSFNYLIELFPDMGLMLSIFIASLVACLPVPLFGFATILGLIIVLFALQFCFNFKPYLPKFIAKKKIHKDFLMKIVGKAGKYEQKLKVYIHPRLSFLFSKNGLKLVFIYIAILGLLLAIPIPIPATNVIFAFPIAIMTLACLHRDGLLLIAGFISSIVGIAGFWLLMRAIFI